MRRKDPSQRLVAFLGLFGVGNFGNEASLRSVHIALRERIPDAQFICVCANPAAVALDHDMPAVSLQMAGLLDHVSTHRWQRIVLRPAIEVARWAAAIRFVGRAEVLIVPGTGILDDYGVRPWEMPYDLFRWSWACRIRRVPLIFVGIGAGPIENRISRLLMRAALSNAASCSYRDAGSLRYMQSIGRRNPTDQLIPDVVFALPTREHSRELNENSPRVGVGVMSYYGWNAPVSRQSEIHEQYFQQIRQVCVHLLEHGRDIDLLYGQRSDLPVATRLRESLLGQGCAPDRVVIPGLNGIEDLVDVIRGEDLVIATRYHNIVAAMLARRPVISIGYAEKNRELLDAAKLGEFAHRIEAVEPIAVIQQAEALLQRPCDAHANLGLYCHTSRKSLDREMDHLTFTAIDSRRTAT